MSAAEIAAGESTQELQTTLTKYKRLLTLARRSIEENQRQIADRDAAIAALQAEVADLNAAAERHHHQQQQSQDDAVGEPLSALRRVEQDGLIWILFAYDDDDDGEEVLAWKRFDSDSALAAYVHREGAEPLRLPGRSLSPEESDAVTEAAEAKVSLIREDYRKYRVRAELSKRQKDAETRLANAGSAADKQRRMGAAAQIIDPARIKQLTDEVNKLQAELAEQDEMWRTAYEKQVREGERLRKEGAETALAAQWRERYEQATREKEDAVAKLDMARSNGSSSANGSSSDSHTDSLEAKYSQLKEEYKLYRKKAMAALQSGGGMPSTPAGSSSAAAGVGGRGRAQSLARTDSFSAGSNDEAKMAYLRNLLLKYLGTEETVARQHMERAMGAVFQFSPAELQGVQAQKAKAAAAGSAGAWLSNVTSGLR